MPRIIAKFSTGELAERAVQAIRDINFTSCLNISSPKVYSGFPCGEPRVSRYSVCETEGGVLLSLDTDMDFLPIAIEAIVDEGGVIQ